VKHGFGISNAFIRLATGWDKWAASIQLMVGRLQLSEP